jgi:hypothetical protein
VIETRYAKSHHHHIDNLILIFLFKNCPIQFLSHRESAEANFGLYLCKNLTFFQKSVCQFLFPYSRAAGKNCSSFTLPSFVTWTKQRGDSSQSSAVGSYAVHHRTIYMYNVWGVHKVKLLDSCRNGRLKKAVSELLLCYFIVKESQDLDHMHWILLYRSSTSRYILSISLDRKTFYCTWLLVAEITFKRPFLTLHFWGIYLFRFDNYICVSCFETWGICINLSRLNLRKMDSFYF